MYKMIIADDEPHTRERLCSSVNWELMDIEIVGEASNGFEAMMLIHDLNPDIIICDIKMPKLDGISLINEVQPSHPNMQVLFLSGYSDKEYLKNAIKLDAVDYIFKPFQLHELITAVEKAKKNCHEKSHKPFQSDSDLAISVLQLNDSESDSLLQDSPFDVNSPFVSIVIKLVQGLVQISDNSGDNLFDAQLAAGQYLGQIRRVLGHAFDEKYILSKAGNGYVIHANVESLKSESFEKLKAVFETVVGARLIIGVGILFPKASRQRFSESYSAALKASHAAFLQGCGKIIMSSELSENCFVPYDNVDSGFFSAVKSNDITAAVSYIDGYLSYMSTCRVDDIPKIKDILTSIAFWFNDRMREFSSNEGYVSDRIHYAADLNEIRLYFNSQMEKYIRHISDLDSKGKLLLEAENYIMENYDKNITIKEIAAHVYITPNYLSYLYKAKTKRTINSFILDVKMERARKMICETSMRLNEISDALGYANQNYFTRTFTKYYGTSPRSYRNSNGSPSAKQEEE